MEEDNNCGTMISAAHVDGLSVAGTKTDCEVLRDHVDDEFAIRNLQNLHSVFVVVHSCVVLREAL